ncbi:tetratricopeptide repeat protein [Bosea caraganae]|nr:tetratricopeptide repeat protein [Bosea caraganae]
MPSKCAAALLAAFGLGLGSLLPAGPAGAAPTYMRLAQTQLSAEDIFWQTIQNSTDPAMFQAYLDQVSKGTFPGTYKPLAEIKLGSLKKDAAPAASGAKPADTAPGRAVIIDPPPPAQGSQAAASSPDVEACDRAAAAPGSREKPANIAGVTFKAIDSSAAIRACRKAIEVAGAPRRVFFQLARALSKSGNDADAMSYYRKGIELGDTDAMHNLAGIVRAGGRGIKRDPGLALALYEKAAAAGVGESLVQLGAMYADGRDVRRDYAKALDYYQRAIEARAPGGYTNMGVLYFNGRGVPRDRNKACEYWREGSALGEDVAASNWKRSCRVR